MTSDRTAAPKTIEAAEARFRTLFDYAQVGVVIADAQSYYLDANPQACRMFGYTREEFIRLHASDIVVPAEAPQVEKALGEIHGRVDHRREWTFRRRDGSVFPADVTATQMPDGTLLGMIRDLSDTQQAHAYREHLAAIVESSRDAILSKNLDGIITSWNDGAEDIFGYTAADALGQPITILIPDDRLEEEHGILARLRQGERVERLETVRRTREGRLIDVSVTISPIEDPGGRIVGASKVARDITAFKARERELARLSSLYAALSHVNQAIVWSPTRDELFRKVCRALVEQGGFGLAWIGWADPDTHRLLPVAECGDEHQYLETINVYTDDRPEGRGPTGTTFRTGRPYIANDISTDAATLPWRAEHVRRGFRASAAFPIRCQGEVVATLSVYARTIGFFYDREVALLEEAVADLSFALDNFERDNARRLAEQTLQSEQRFSNTMIDSMPGVLYFYDVHGRFLRWNRNFETVTGYSAAEIARMHPRDFFPEAERPRLEARIAEVFAGGQSSLEAPLVARDGTVTPYFFTGRRVLFEGEPCLVGVGIDISDRRRAEEALRASEAHLVDAQRIAGMGSWELDLRTHALSGSDQTYAIFGVRRSDFDGSLGALVEFVHPDDRQRLEEARLAAIAGQAPFDIEHRIVLPDGTEKVVREIAALKTGEDGTPILLAGVVHDITDRARLEVERARRHQAEAADRIKSAFLATMSHELRTPLNSIIGFTGIVLKGLAGPLNAEQTKQLDMVRASARHLLALVNDVLDISKIEAGQLEVARQPFDPCRSIAKVLALVAPQVEARGLELRSEVPAQLPPAVGDERRFEQILLNLLSNAIKFTERGHVRLETQVLPEGEAAGGPSIRLRVSDTGMGIRPEHLPTLFQPFRQIDAGPSRQHDGTGLGLAICRRLATLMGGSIEAESEWGQGSTFSVTLPLNPPPPG